MAEAEPVPIEKASFPNNVDVLVFEGRCEYRTHSRTGYFVAGVIGLALAALGIWFCIYLAVISPAEAGRFASDERTFGYVVSAIVLPLSVLMLWAGANSFRRNPWFVVSPEGVEFRNRLSILSFKPKDFLVRFGDIDWVDGEEWYESRGKYETSRRVYTVQICTNERGDLNLPWSTYNEEL